MEDQLLSWFLVGALPLHLAICVLSLLALRNREYAYLARMATLPLLLSIIWVSLFSVYTLFVGLWGWMLRDYRAGTAGSGHPIAVAIFAGVCALLQIVFWSQMPDFLWTIIDATEPFGMW